jgi:hypothetical protein
MHQRPPSPGAARRLAVVTLPIRLRILVFWRALILGFGEHDVDYGQGFARDAARARARLFGGDARPRLPARTLRLLNRFGCAQTAFRREPGGKRAELLASYRAGGIGPSNSRISCTATKIAITSACDDPQRNGAWSSEAVARCEGGQKYRARRGARLPSLRAHAPLRAKPLAALKPL